MPDLTDDDESMPSSPQETEQSTRYISMVRNELGPSPLSPNQIRKQAQLRDRSARLKRRYADIKQKCMEVKQRQKSWESMASSQMIVQFSQADERRKRHLDQIRERAQTLRMLLRKQKDYHFEQTRVVAFPGECTYTSWEKQSKSKDETVKSRESYSGSEIYSARVLQRAIRLKILQKELADQNTRTLIDNVVHHKISYSQAVELLTGVELKGFWRLLEALNLPTASLLNGYSWFFYSIALISDFQEFSRETTSVHPGFNVNIQNCTTNSLTNVLPIVLYRYATRIFCELRRILQSPHDTIKLPVSIARLTLARYWREYHCFFSLFKFNHAQAMKEIAAEALDIAVTHQRILKSLEGKKDRSFRDRVHFFERFNLFIRMARFKGLPWAEVCDKKLFPKEILSYTNHLDKILEGTKKDLDLLYDVRLMSDDNHQHAVVTISRGEEKYSIPPNIPISVWRRFFFDHFKEKLLANSHYGCPLVTRSGSRSIPQLQPTICIDEVLTLVEAESPVLSEEESFVSQCDTKLRTLFNKYVAYCEYIGAEDLHDTLKNYDQLCSLYTLSDTNTVGIGQAQSYIKLFMLLLMQLLHFASVDNSVALAFVVEVEKGIDNILSNFEFLYRHLEATLNVKWISHCLIRDVQQFINFENFYQMTGNDSFRRNLGTDFPQLRFRQFYQFVFMNSQSKCDARSAALVMIYGTKCGPRYLKSRLNEKALRFFSIVIINFFSNDLHLAANEKVSFHRVGDIQLFSLMQSQLISLNSRFRNLLILSCLASMLHLTISQSSTLKSMLETDEPRSPDYASLKDHLTDFQWNYLVQATSQISEGKLKVFDVFTQKLRSAIFSLGGPNDFFDANFPHFASEWNCLHGDIADMCMVFYGLYGPILNWIYTDLGSPSG